MISFHDVASGFKLKQIRNTKRWLHDVANMEKKAIGQIDIIFCLDDYLLNLNQKHLKHDYYTDIMTFDYSDNQNVITGDLYISITRVRENALIMKISVEEELRRVMVHGLLHLIGYNDKTLEEEKEMRMKENGYLEKYR